MLFYSESFSGWYLLIALWLHPRFPVFALVSVLISSPDFLTDQPIEWWDSLCGTDEVSLPRSYSSWLGTVNPYVASKREELRNRRNGCVNAANHLHDLNSCWVIKCYTICRVTQPMVLFFFLIMGNRITCILSWPLGQSYDTKKIQYHITRHHCIEPS